MLATEENILKSLLRKKTRFLNVTMAISAAHSTKTHTALTSTRQIPHRSSSVASGPPESRIGTASAYHSFVYSFCPSLHPHAGCVTNPQTYIYVDVTPQPLTDGRFLLLSKMSVPG